MWCLYILKCCKPYAWRASLHDCERQPCSRHWLSITNAYIYVTILLLLRFTCMLIIYCLTCVYLPYLPASLYMDFECAYIVCFTRTHFQIHWPNALEIAWMLVDSVCLRLGGLLYHDEYFWWIYCSCIYLPSRAALVYIEVLWAVPMACFLTHSACITHVYI